MSFRNGLRYVLFILVALILISLSRAVYSGVRASGGVTTPYPILFVTQIPIRNDFTTIGSTFGNHDPAMQSVGRGGDLWIRYPDGTQRNLTAEAGYGSDGFQGDDAIAVRDPAVHWDGTKAVFSMVIGAPTERYQWETYYWQLYEVTGLGPGETAVITKVPHQPATFNNISPIYSTTDDIIFTSDRPHNGAMHLHPQRDEYELAPTNSGLWRLNPATGDLTLLNHAPSGDFTPVVDSYGRVVFTQWDHLQRDQEADADATTPPGEPLPYGTFNYTSEAADATPLWNDRSEVFPEPRPDRVDLLAGTNLNGHRFNHFFPWTINEDGTESEVLAHLGRHELHGYIEASINDDPNIIEYYGQYPRTNPNEIENMFQIKEDPTNPGLYLGVDAPEFYTHASGQIISMMASPTMHGDEIIVNYLTHPDNTNGHFREPLPLSDGTLLAVHTDDTDSESGSGSPTNSSYEFRIKTVVPSGQYRVADQLLTTGISKSVSYWDPDTMVTYNGVLWELNPVEVRARTRPIATTSPPLAPPEQQIFDEVGVSFAQLQAYLVQHDLALVVSRNVTTRDDLDRQQPFNLRIEGTNTQTTGAAGTLYDIAHIQFFQGDQIRGFTGGYGATTPRPGRRVLAQPMHDTNAQLNNRPTTGPDGSAMLGSDGSMAAFVPANRAMTWQLTDEAGMGVVRERYWVTFQPGELRLCTSCHGLNEYDQANQPMPTNPPEALRELLIHWQTLSNMDEQAFLPLIRH